MSVGTCSRDEGLVSPASLSYESIRDYAEQVGRRYSIWDEQGHANIERLVTVLGGQVVYENSAKALVVRGKGDFTIFLPTATSHRRDRFMAAHELGHYFLHYRVSNEEGEKTFFRGGSSVAETQSNVFASALIMPSQGFMEAFRELGGDVRSLSYRFQASPRAVEVRCELLGLR